jgi:hypothetical protein
MINELTEEQKALLPVYRDKWMKIGLSTGPADRTKAEDAIRRAYKIAALDEPKQIIWSTSPLVGWIVVCILKNDKMMKKLFKEYQKLGDSVWASVGNSVWASVGDSVGDSVEDSVEDSVGDSVGDSVWDSVGDSVRASVRASVRNSVWDSVRDSIWDSVRDSVWDSVRASVRDSIWDSVRASVRDSVRNSVGDSVGDSVWDSVGDSVKGFNYFETIFGSHEAHWLGFYDYFFEVLKLESCSKLIPLMDFAKEGGWFYPYKNVCMVTERPIEIHMKDQRIHNDGGPAIRYSDEFSVWALNGVRVPQEIAETKAEDINVDRVLKEKNAEVRKEIIRKIGMERLLNETKPEILDQAGSYTLYNFNLGEDRVRPYLKMINPSTNQIHVEGIHPDCKTVFEALSWRNGIDKWQEPKILT